MEKFTLKTFPSKILVKWGHICTDEAFWSEQSLFPITGVTSTGAVIYWRSNWCQICRPDVNQMKVIRSAGEMFLVSNCLKRNPSQWETSKVPRSLYGTRSGLRVLAICAKPHFLLFHVRTAENPLTCCWAGGWGCHSVQVGSLLV